MTTILFRFDDFGYFKRQREKERLRLTEAVLNIFHRHGMHHAVGVIPERVSGRPTSDEQRVHSLSDSKRRMEVLENIVGAETGEVALHGLTHERRSFWNCSEFVGLSPERQHRKLERGKALLRTWTGRAPDVFIPPWNKLDRTTLKLLSKLSFRTVSSWLPLHSFIRRNSSLRSIPQCLSARRLQQRLKTLTPALPLIVVVLHDYEFREFSTESGVLTLDQLRDIVQWIASHPRLRTAPMTDTERDEYLDERYSYRVFLTQILAGTSVSSRSTVRQLENTLWTLEPVFPSEPISLVLRKMAALLAATDEAPVGTFGD